MGAFGEDLIRNFGGDIDSYRGINKKNDEKPFEKPFEKIEKKKEMIELMKMRAEKIIESLKSSLIYYPHEIHKYTEDVIKINLKNDGFNTEIQNLMWENFEKFKNTFQKKDNEKNITDIKQIKMERIINQLKEQRKNAKEKFIQNSIIKRNVENNGPCPDTDDDLDIIEELNKAISILENDIAQNS